MKNNKQTNRKYIYLFFCVCFIFFGLRVDNCWAGTNPFIQTAIVSYRSAIPPEEIASLAKYDVMSVNRFSYDDVGGSTWSAIKAINPAIEIYVYQTGTDVYSNMDGTSQLYLNNISRYNSSRGHSMGSVNGNHPEFFLLKADGTRLPGPPANREYRWAMDFGLTSYQDYWAESTKTDIIDQAWKADGIFIDNTGVATTPEWPSYPVKYPNSTAWAPAMRGFLNAMTNNFHSLNQKIFANAGISRLSSNYAPLLALDVSAHPPDVIMDEAAFAVMWGWDVQFYPEADWKRSVDLTRALQNMKIVHVSSTVLTPANPNGIDNAGQPVTFWQALWFSMCSYHLARHDAPNNAYFMFGSGNYGASASTFWFDEYDRINLGAVVSDYSGPTTVGNAHVYMREFANGWIYVNPTSYGVASLTLPASGRQLTHENINSNPLTLPMISTVSVPAHSGVIVLKSVNGVPPSAPQGLSVK